MAAIDSVRVEERLKIKIGEAKNLMLRSHGSTTQRDVYCKLSLDQEEIFRTSTIEKTLCPFFGVEYQFEVPRKFRYLSVYLYDRDKHLKQDKVLGKVAIKREDLHTYNNKDHWFPIKAVDADSEVQGKANIEIKFLQSLSSTLQTGATSNTSTLCKRVSVRVVECADLTLNNGACDPYAIVTAVYTNGKQSTKRTKVRKKTVCPQFEEVFVFDREERSVSGSSSSGANSGEYTVCSLNNGPGDVEICEINVSLWHDSPGMNNDVFLGEVRVPLRGVQTQNATDSAWYFLQPRSGKNKPSRSCSTPPGTRLSCDNSLGSLRLKVQYTADHVFPSNVYEPLRKLLLESAHINPITSSAVYILGEIVESKTEAAQPLVRLFIHHKEIVPIIRALANSEIGKLTDPTTIFRGNTLVSKMMDESMRLIGLQYLHKTLRPSLDIIFSERKPCEIDPTKVKDSTTISSNLTNLKYYVELIFKSITQSGVHCPALMCQIFHNLKECAMTFFPDNKEVRYSVISGFIFLRFFAPAILGPRLFDLTTEQIDAQTNRTLTLISKIIQSLGNLVSCRSAQQICKEEYMECVYKEFYTDSHLQDMKSFLEIVSASSCSQTTEIDVPVVIKQGLMIKRAQGRKRFGRKNFKQRYFRLTTHDLSYSKSKTGKQPLCSIPMRNIVGVERLEEKSFKMNNMFQIIQPERTLYVQAANCVEEKEWVDLLTKICQTNSNRREKFHPCAFINGLWLCCKSSNELTPGCEDVSPVQESQELHMTLDPERDLERVQSLLISHMAHLEALKAMLECETGGYSGVDVRLPFPIDDAQSCFQTLNQLREIAYQLEQKHRAYRRTLARDTKYGSKAAPIGDDNYLHLTRGNLDSTLIRRCVNSEPTMST